MPLVTCPACGKTSETEGRHAGRKVRCKGCGTVVRVPGEPGDEPAPLASPASPPKVVDWPVETDERVDQLDQDEPDDDADDDYRPRRPAPPVPVLCVVNLAVGVMALAAALSPLVIQTPPIISVCVWALYLPVAALGFALSLVAFIGNKDWRGLNAASMVVSILAGLLILGVASYENRNRGIDPARGVDGFNAGRLR